MKYSQPEIMISQRGSVSLRSPIAILKRCPRGYTERKLTMSGVMKIALMMKIVHPKIALPFERAYVRYAEKANHP